MLNRLDENENGKMKDMNPEEDMGFRLKNTDVFTLYKEAEAKGLADDAAHDYVNSEMKKNGEWFIGNQVLSL